MIKINTAGFNIIACKDGGQAHEKLVELAEHAKAEGVGVSKFLDAVITDVEMPRMDGMHLLKRLREHPDYGDMPIVMFSSIMSEDNREKALALGANDTITKPEIGKMVSLMDKFVF